MAASSSGGEQNDSLDGRVQTRTKSNFQLSSAVKEPLLVRTWRWGIGSAFRTGGSTMNGEGAVVCWV